MHVNAPKLRTLTLSIIDKDISVTYLYSVLGLNLVLFSVQVEKTISVKTNDATVSKLVKLNVIELAQTVSMNMHNHFPYMVCNQKSLHW